MVPLRTADRRLKDGISSWAGQVLGRLCEGIGILDWNWSWGHERPTWESDVVDSDKAELKQNVKDKDGALVWHRDQTHGR